MKTGNRLSVMCAAAVLALAPAAVLVAQSAKSGDDPLLDAMKAELGRSRQIKLENFPSPYFIEYRVENGASYAVSASLGAVLTENKPDYCMLTVRSRVGDYGADDTNYVFTGMPAEAPSFSSRLPGDASPELLRRNLWLATDFAYKSALASFARKQAALRNLAAKSDLPDFWKTSPASVLLPVERKDADEALWRGAVKKLSAIFKPFPEVQQSQVSFEWGQSATRYVNTEGSTYRVPDNMAVLRVTAHSQAPDGMPLRMSYNAVARSPGALPPEPKLELAAHEAAQSLSALVNAPAGDAYTGPVLFEPEAAAQILGELLRSNLPATRKPVSEPGRPARVQESDFDGRIGSRVMPEWMTVVDDPTQTEWQGRPLFGSYAVDLEGVAPSPLVLIENGVLKNMYLTRQPVEGFTASNGHARLPGRYGANRSAPGNLFIRAGQTSPLTELKKKLIETATARHKPYGMLVTKMDFPSIAGMEVLRAMFASSQGEGDSRPESQPLLVYRVYPDGREELVRGVQFRRLDSRSLRDITAASEETAQFDYVDNGAAMALAGAGSFVVGVSVVAPGVLFDELELEPIRGEWQKPPLVPPPPMNPSF